MPNPLNGLTEPNTVPIEFFCVANHTFYELKKSKLVPWASLYLFLTKPTAQYLQIHHHINSLKGCHRSETQTPLENFLQSMAII